MFKTVEARVWDLQLLETADRNAGRIVICATPGNLFQVMGDVHGVDMFHVGTMEQARELRKDNVDGAEGLIAEVRDGVDCDAGDWARLCLDLLVAALDYAFPGCADVAAGGGV